MDPPAADPAARARVYVWRRDLSFWALLLTNLLVIGFTLYAGAGFFEVVWIFWFQSVIIGFFTLLDMLLLRDYSTEGVAFFTESGGRTKEYPLKPSLLTKALLAGFFVLTYGFLHAMYASFLVFFMVSSIFHAVSPIEPFDFFVDYKCGDGGCHKVEHPSFDLDPFFAAVFAVLAAAGVFFINHLFSFVYNLSRKRAKENIGTIFLRPYERIAPMHITVVLAGFVWMLTGSSLLLMLLFLLVKTAADLYSHVKKHIEEEALPGG